MDQQEKTPNPDPRPLRGCAHCGEPTRSKWCSEWCRKQEEQDFGE